MNVRELVEVVERNKGWYPPFPSSFVNSQCMWKTLIKKTSTCSQMSDGEGEKGDAVLFFFLRFLFIRVNIPFSILMVSWCLLGTLNEGILSDTGLKSNASRVKSMTLFGLCLLLFKSNSILTTLKFCRNELSNILFEDWLNDACFTALWLEKLTAESRLFLKIVFPSLYYLHGLIKNSCILIQTFRIQKIY